MYWGKNAFNTYDLHEACRKGDYDTAARLLTSGEVDIDCPQGPRKSQSDQRTALIMATHKGNARIVACLLRHGARTEPQDIINQTALHHAANLGEVEIAKMLLSAGADPNATCRGGNTPLLGAAVWGHADVAKALLDAGAKVDATDDHGRTSLLWAVERNRMPVVEVLLAAGADVHTRDAYSRSALDRAVKLSKELVERLLIAGANATATDGRGWGPLHWAASHGDVEILQLLLSVRGIDVNQRDTAQGGEETHTPLRCAVERQHVAAAKALITAGADVNLIPRNRRSLLMLTALHRGTAEMAEALLAAGAGSNEVDRLGRTALDVALARGNKPVALALMKAGAPFTWKEELIPASVTLVRGGYRKWEHIPVPTPHLEVALLQVWERDPEDLGPLFKRLNLEVQRRIQTAVLCLKRCIPELEDKLLMGILQDCVVMPHEADPESEDSMDDMMG